MPRHSPQYLTAKLKLRPTRRKAAALERARASAEDAFWAEMLRIKDEVATLPKMETKKERNAALRAITDPKKLARYGLPSAVCDGVSADIEAAASSFVELEVGGFEPNWPERPAAAEGRYEDGLDALAVSLSKEEEDTARDNIYRGGLGAKYRGIRIARGRECTLVRKYYNGPIAVALNVLIAKDDRARRVTIEAGIDATTGEVRKAKSTAANLLVPVELSKWHQQKFLNGSAILRSSIITREGDDWYMLAQFEMPTPEAVGPSAILGVDRGIVLAASAALVGMDGAVKRLAVPGGGKIRAAIRDAERRNRAHQRRFGRPRAGHREAVDYLLHQVANELVALARQHKAAIAIEALGGLKDVMGTKREKGARRNIWQKSLRAMQLTKLEEILKYKLKLAGMPELVEVVAGGTSQTCSACGHKHKDNRTTQEVFECVECGYKAHADLNAAVQIARRGVMSARNMVKKGSKLDDLHQDMVEGLRSRDDGGLGPLPASAGAGFVADLDSGQSANEVASVALTPDRVKNLAERHAKPPSEEVFAERCDSQKWNGVNDVPVDRSQ